MKPIKREPSKTGVARDLKTYPRNGAKKLFVPNVLDTSENAPGDARDFISGSAPLGIIPRRRRNKKKRANADQDISNGATEFHLRDCPKVCSPETFERMPSNSIPCHTSDQDHRGDLKMPYSAKETAGILNAVKMARETGTWEDAFTKAHAAGYQGSLSYLRKMVAERNKEAGVARRKQRTARGK